MARVAKSAPIQPIDPRHPQPRHIRRAVGVLADGGIVSYPTDTYYALGCDLFQKKAMERLAALKRRDDRRPFAFLCADLGEVAKYGIVSNENYRRMRRLLPCSLELSCFPPISGSHHKAGRVAVLKVRLRRPEHPKAGITSGFPGGR